MDWLWQPVDIYCERLAPGLWAEPLNAVSNLGFLVAAALLLVHGRKENHERPILVLSVLVLCVGFASLSFHTLANGLTGLLDILFILAFILSYVWIFLRQVYGLKTWESTAGLTCFLVLSILMHVTIQNYMRVALSMYLPVMLMLWLFAVDLLRRQHKGGLPMLCCALIFTVSLMLRTLDYRLCGLLPIGTHFLWHLLNAVLLYLLVHILMKDAAEKAKEERGNSSLL